MLIWRGPRLLLSNIGHYCTTPTGRSFSSFTKTWDLKSTGMSATANEQTLNSEAGPSGIKRSAEDLIQGVDFKRTKDDLGETLKGDTYNAKAKSSGANAHSDEAVTPIRENVDEKVIKSDVSTSKRFGSRRKQDKSKKNQGRRRGTRREGEDTINLQREEGEESKALRLPKRMCALLIGYCGAGFRGMQIQPGVRTVEGTLFEALATAGAVSKDNSDNLTKVSFQRAARTDAGVHAAGNVVSLKMITEIPGVPDIIARINEELPPEIRVWSFVRVQNSFNARLSCDSRKYTYYFPSYLMIPPKPGSGLFRTFHQLTSLSSESAIKGSEDEGLHDFWKDAESESTHEQDAMRKKRWRIGADGLAALRVAAKKYEGTHNFHNFTVERDYKDRANFRYMKQLEVSDPEVHNEVEWLRVIYHGQSFMFNQIRKMMFALIFLCRTSTPLSAIDELYGPKKVHIPKMPALGLLLDGPLFQSYNDRVAQIDPSKPEHRLPISLDEHREAIEAFKQEQIFSRMRTAEERYQVFDQWVRSVDAYAGPDLLYLNPEGNIPEAAIIRRGEKRLNAFKEKRQFDKTDFGADSVDVDITDDIEEEVDKNQLAELEG